MKHIIYISHSRGFHGAERIMVGRLRSSLQAGDRVTLVMPSILPDRDLDAVVSEMEGVEIRCLPYRAAGGSLLRTLLVMIYNLPALLRLTRLCRREHADELFSNTSVTILGVMAARLTGLPHLWHFHEPVDPLYGWSDSLRGLYRRFCNTRSSEVIFISRRQRQEWETALGCPIAGRVEYNPIMPIHRVEVPPHEGIRIGYLGHFEERKNILMLIRVFERLHAEFPDTQLLLCGAESDQERDTLLSQTLLAEPALRILPATREVAQFYSSLDVFCLPSRKETMPLVSLEAIGCGVCTLQTDQSGLSELLADGVDTLFLSPSDSDAWLNALRRCMNPSYRATMALNGQNKWKQLCEL